MNCPPEYPEFGEPRVPHWRGWWLGLGLLVGGQSTVLLMLWPEEQPRLQLLLWSVVLPLCCALALAVRVLAWQIDLFNRKVYLQTVEAAMRAWWQHRRLALPVQDVVLLGPVGDVQARYLNLMKGVPLPKPSVTADSTLPRLRCPVSLSLAGERPLALARHLARLTLTVPALAECWPTLRAVAWAGDESSQAAYVEVLAKAGMAPTAARLSLQNLADLDDVIDTFHRDCPGADDWLLCAGVVSVQGAKEGEVPGEAGFVWRVSRTGRQLLHRSECQAGEPAVQVCEQLQRYAGLQAPPDTCLALDETSQQAFVEGGWSASAHQLAGHWGVLAHLAPFIGMSLALLHAAESGQPCGWQSQDGNQQLAIGVAVPYGNS